MKFVKKLYVTIIAAALLLTIGSVTALANNSSDTSFSFTYPPNGSTTAYTAARAKVDNSSAYMKLQYLSRSDAFYYASVVKSNYSNFSKTWTYTFNSSNLNQGRYLSNYAYEDLGVNVLVRIKGQRGGNISPSAGFTASGVWSPDSY